MRCQDRWLTATAGTMKRSLRLNDSISSMSSADKEKSNTCRFCWILEGVTLLGIHTTPLCTCHLPQTQQEVTGLTVCLALITDHAYADEVCPCLTWVWPGQVFSGISEQWRQVDCPVADLVHQERPMVGPRCPEDCMLSHKLTPTCGRGLCNNQ